MPGIASGRVTVVNVFQRLAPRFMAQVSRSGSIACRIPVNTRKPNGKRLVDCTMISPGNPYMFASSMPKMPMVTRPFLPNSRITERANIKGGEMMGIRTIPLKNFPPGICMRVSV